MEFTYLKAAKVLQEGCLLSITKSPKVFGTHLISLEKSESSKELSSILNLGTLHWYRSSVLTTRSFLMTLEEI